MTVLSYCVRCALGLRVTQVALSLCREFIITCSPVTVTTVIIAMYLIIIVAVCLTLWLCSVQLCSYGMLASMSCVLKEAMAEQLDAVVARILQALQSEDGVTVSGKLGLLAVPSVSYCCVCVCVCVCVCPHPGALCHVRGAISRF